MEKSFKDFRQQPNIPPGKILNFNLRIEITVRVERSNEKIVFLIRTASIRVHLNVQSERRFTKCRNHNIKMVWNAMNYSPGYSCLNFIYLQLKNVFRVEPFVRKIIYQNNAIPKMAWVSWIKRPCRWPTICSSITFEHTSNFVLHEFLNKLLLIIVMNLVLLLNNYNFAWLMIYGKTYNIRIDLTLSEIICV